MKDKVQKLTQTFARAIIQPVMFMAVAGLIIAFAAILKIEQMPKFVQTIGNGLFTVLNGAAIGQLSVIFCVGIATAIAKKKKVDAAILAITTYLIFLYANNFWLTLTHSLAKPGSQGLYGTGQNMILGVQATDMGVFLGIILGCLVGFFVNKFGNIKFHKWLAPYEGTKFAYVLLILTTIILAIVLTYVWPPINHLVNLAVGGMSGMGALGFFFYGFLNRMMLPFGMHHLLWMPIYYTPLGGTAKVAGKAVSGAMNIWFAEVGNAGSLTHIDASVGYLANFGYIALPIGIALAIIKTAKPENKARVKGILFPAMIAAALGGVTEPIEFLFLFISPVLWLAHAIVYGFGLWLSNVLGLRMLVENVINTTMYSLSIPPSLGHQWLIIPIGLFLVGLEYIVFKTMIEKLKIPTLGREDIAELDGDSPKVTPVQPTKPVAGGEATPVPEMTAATPDATGEANPFDLIVNGLGGVGNIEEINNCFSRLRIDVADATKINLALLKQYPSSGVIQNHKNVQIVVGMGVQDVSEELNEYVDDVRKNTSDTPAPS